MRKLVFAALISILPLISFSQYDASKYHRDDAISRDSVIEIFFNKLNDQRIEAGLDSVIHIDHMDSTARSHSLEMVRVDSTFHNNIGKFGYTLESILEVEAIWYQNADFLANHILKMWRYNESNSEGLDKRNCYAGLDFAINKQTETIYITYNAICLGN